jgi:hypothetical protein
MPTAIPKILTCTDTCCLYIPELPLKDCGIPIMEVSLYHIKGDWCVAEWSQEFFLN